MNEVPIATFVEAIHAIHGVTASLASRERVHEQFEGKTVWEGEVLIFDLDDHPTALWCFAWEVDGELTAVLAEGPIETANDAVMASIFTTGGETPEA